MLSRHRAALFLGSGAAALALATGCSSGTTQHAATTATSPAAPSSPSTSSAKPVLETKSTNGLGVVVTDSNGFTLYRFDHDSNNPSKTTCTTTDGCSSLWPPALTTNGDTKVQGNINQGMVSTVTRPDGTTQLTLGGWPLYRYAPDSKPGDTKGQGVDGLWFASTTTGDKAMATTSSPSGGGSSGGGGGGGYGY